MRRSAAVHPAGIARRRARSATSCATLMTALLVAWSTLDAAELRARLRSLQALVRVFAGPAGAELVKLLHQAEADPSLLPACDCALARLPTVPLRRALATLAATLPSPSPR